MTESAAAMATAAAFETTNVVSTTDAVSTTNAVSTADPVDPHGRRFECQFCTRSFSESTPLTALMRPVTSVEGCAGCVLGYLATSLLENKDEAPILRHVVTRQSLELPDVLRLVHALDAGPYGVVVATLAELHTSNNVRGLDPVRRRVPQRPPFTARAERL